MTTKDSKLSKNKVTRESRTLCPVILRQADRPCRAAGRGWFIVVGNMVNTSLWYYNKGQDQTNSRGIFCFADVSTE